MASHVPGGQPEFRTLIERVFREGRRESALTLNVLRTHWTGIVGAELARRTYPLRQKRDTLVVAAGDACWAYELQFHKREVLAAVQAFLQSDAVADVAFCADPLPDAAPAAEATPPEPAEGTGACSTALHEQEPAPRPQPPARPRRSTSPRTPARATAATPPAAEAPAPPPAERRTAAKRQLERMRRLAGR